MSCKLLQDCPLLLGRADTEASDQTKPFAPARDFEAFDFQPSDQTHWTGSTANTIHVHVAY